MNTPLEMSETTSVGHISQRLNIICLLGCGSIFVMAAPWHEIFYQKVVLLINIYSVLLVSGWPVWFPMKLWERLCLNICCVAGEDRCLGLRWVKKLSKGILENEEEDFLSVCSWPVPHAGVGDLQSWRAGVEPGEVRQDRRTHEPRPGAPERSHHALCLLWREESDRDIKTFPAALNRKLRLFKDDLNL